MMSLDYEVIFSLCLFEVVFHTISTHVDIQNTSQTSTPGPYGVEVWKPSLFAKPLFADLNIRSAPCQWGGLG